MFPPEVWEIIFQFISYKELLQVRLINKFFNDLVLELANFHVTIEKNGSYEFSQRVHNITSLSLSYLDYSIASLIESQNGLKRLEFFSKDSNPFEIPLDRINITEIEKLVIDFPLQNRSEIIVPSSLHIRKLELKCSSLQLIDFLNSDAKIDQLTMKKTDQLVECVPAKRPIHCLKFCLDYRFSVYQIYFGTIDYLIFDYRKLKRLNNTITIHPNVKNVIIKVDTLSQGKEIILLRALGKMQNIIIIDEAGVGNVIVDISGTVQNLCVFAFHCIIQKIDSKGFCHIFSGDLSIITFTYVELRQINMKLDEFEEGKRYFKEKYLNKSF